MIILLLLFLSQLQHVQIIGELRSIHQNGNASPRVTLSDVVLPHTYAIGPVADLQGEVAVWDGVTSVTKVVDGKLLTHNSLETKAALLAYGVVKTWKPLLTLEKQTPLNELSSLISKHLPDEDPTWVKVETIATSMKWHVIHWPLGTPIEKGNHKRHALHGSDDNEKVKIIGVYAPKGAGVITHHDSNLHLHAITSRGEVVHIEDVVLSAGSVVMIPE